MQGLLPVPRKRWKHDLRELQNEGGEVVTTKATALQSMLPIEAASHAGHRGDFEAMAKRRYQDPTPKRVGNFWYLLTWEDGPQGTRKRKRQKLAPASMTVREVQKIADEILRPLNQALISVGSAVNFKEYVESTYIPTE